MSVGCYRMLALTGVIFMCLFLLAFIGGGCSPNNIITESKAIKIAEKEFVERFGGKVLEQRPWIISETNNVYMIRGTLRTRLGGVATIEIRRDDGSVVRCTHGQ